MSAPAQAIMTADTDNDNTAFDNAVFMAGIVAHPQPDKQCTILRRKNILSTATAI